MHPYGVSDLTFLIKPGIDLCNRYSTHKNQPPRQNKLAAQKTVFAPSSKYPLSLLLVEGPYLLLFKENTP